MVAQWKITILKKIKLSKSVLIEGMPGIGNVGKIAADTIVEQVKAEKIASFFSTCLPNSVFVKQNNLVEMPKIEIFHKRMNKKDFLFLVGDVQPMGSEDSYAFAESILSFAKQNGCNEIIALGGIGLAEVPANSRVYCTGNDQKLVDEYVELGVSNKLFGFVGPVMGVTGLLLGLGMEKKMRAVAILAETYSHQMHIGFRESKELMKVLDKRYGFGLDLSKVEKEIKKFETGLRPIAKQQKLEEEKSKESHLQDTNYIG